MKLLFIIALVFILAGIVLGKSVKVEQKSISFFNKLKPIGRLEYFALTFILLLISYFLFFYLKPIISEFPKNIIRNFYMIFCLIVIVLHSYFKLQRIKDIDSNYESNKIYHWFLFIFLAPIILALITFILADLSSNYEYSGFYNSISVATAFLSISIYVYFDLYFLFKSNKKSKNLLSKTIHFDNNLEDKKVKSNRNKKKSVTHLFSNRFSNLFVYIISVFSILYFSKNIINYCTYESGTEISINKQANHLKDRFIQISLLKKDFESYSKKKELLNNKKELLNIEIEMLKESIKQKEEEIKSNGYYEYNVIGQAREQWVPNNQRQYVDFQVYEVEPLKKELEYLKKELENFNLELSSFSNSEINRSYNFINYTFKEELSQFNKSFQRSRILIPLTRDFNAKQLNSLENFIILIDKMVNKYNLNTFLTIIIILFYLLSFILLIIVVKSDLMRLYNFIKSKKNLSKKIKKSDNLIDKNKISKLKEYKDLLDLGVITKKEYNNYKAELFPRVNQVSKKKPIKESNNNIKPEGLPDWFKGEICSEGENVETKTRNFFLNANELSMYDFILSCLLSYGMKLYNDELLEHFNLAVIWLSTKNKEAVTAIKEDKNLKFDLMLKESLKIKKTYK